MRGFAPIVILIVVAVVISVGSAGVLAWKTTVLDPYLPADVKTFLGKQPVSSSTPSNSELKVEDATKDWKTYTSANVGYTLKYPSSWAIEEGTYQGFPSVIIKSSGKGLPTLGVYQNFQGGFENVGRAETKKFESAGGSEISASVMYREGDENEVTVLVAPYSPSIDLTLIYTFNLAVEPGGLEILALILSTFSLL